MTTNITKPTGLPEWDTNQTQTVEPNQDHKDDGWPEVSPGIFGKPPAEYFNFWMNLVYLWLQSLDSYTDVSTETDRGTIELATQTEVNTGTDTERAVTPATLSGRTATETRTGIAELATQTEVNTGTDTSRIVTPATLHGRQATETLSGIAELATQTEVNTGTDTSRIVTPATLKGQKAIFVNNANGNPNISDTPFDIDASVSTGAWESVGSTGSGADNIWAALDALPSDIDWIEVKCRLGGVDGAVTSALSIQTYARKNGSSEAIGDDNLINSIADQSDASGKAYASGMTVIKIQVSSKKFDIYWAKSFTTTNLCWLYLTGYGYN